MPCATAVRCSHRAKLSSSRNSNGYMEILLPCLGLLLLTIHIQVTSMLLKCFLFFMCVYSMYTHICIQIHFWEEVGRCRHRVFLTWLTNSNVYMFIRSASFISGESDEDTTNTKEHLTLQGLLTYMVLEFFIKSRLCFYNFKASKHFK